MDACRGSDEKIWSVDRDHKAYIASLRMSVFSRDQSIEKHRSVVRASEKDIRDLSRTFVNVLHQKTVTPAQAVNSCTCVWRT